jgi:hypothetical protein
MANAHVRQLARGPRGGGYLSARRARRAEKRGCRCGRGSATSRRIGSSCSSTIVFFLRLTPAPAPPRSLKRAPSPPRVEEEEGGYDPERPGLLEGGALSAAQRARAFEWGGRTSDWWLSDTMHRFAGRVEYPIQLYGDLLPAAEADAGRVEAVERHVRAAALEQRRALLEDEAARYARLRVVDVFVDEMKAAETAGERAAAGAALGAMMRALDAGFRARALEQRRTAGLMPRDLPRAAPASGAEVWRASRDEEAVRRAEAAAATRAVASRFVDLGGLPPPTEPRRRAASRGGAASSSRGGSRGRR